jgi:hypothetical protein
MSFAVAQGVTKHVIIWQSGRGIEMFDGNALASVSDDIKDFFDPTQPNYINTAVVDTFYGFYDEVNYEYHWLCATGGSTALNRELVFDLRRKKWFEINRGTGKRLNCGITAQDTKGNKYVYGGTTDGYIERLENGTSFDGNSIAHTFEFGDVPLAKSIMYDSVLSKINLVAVAKNVSGATVSISLYQDTGLTPITIPVISQADSIHRLYGVAGRSEILRSRADGPSTTHRLAFTVSTTGETVGFEPIMVSGLFRVAREDVS